jgi:hypothetical protein
MYSMSYYYNCCVSKPLGHEFSHKAECKCIKNILRLLVYSSFLSFVVLFQHIKL